MSQVNPTPKDPAEPVMIDRPAHHDVYNKDSDSEEDLADYMNSLDNVKLSVEVDAVRYSEALKLRG